jgi:hypothetical protein
MAGLTTVTAMRVAIPLSLGPGSGGRSAVGPDAGEIDIAGWRDPAGLESRPGTADVNCADWR